MSTTALPARNRPPVPPEFVRRCGELGLVTWRLDLNGTPVEDPSAGGVLALWLSSQPIRRILNDLAEHWMTQESPQFTQPIDGCWMIPFAEVHRRRRTGYFIAVGFGPEILSNPLVESGCSGGSLQLASVKHALKGRAILDERQACTLDSALTWMHDDLSGSIKSSETIDGFTDQLSDTYESITMLYELGRSMGALDEPDAYIQQSAEKAASTLGYRWVSILLDGLQSDIVAQTQVGEQQMDDDQLNAVLSRVNHETPDAVANGALIYAVDYSDEFLTPQLIAHPITRGERTFGYILAGGKLGDDPQVSTHETKTLESMAGLLGAFLENAELYDEQKRTFLGTVKAMSSAIDAKDHYTRGHSDRVAYMSAEIARAMGFSDADVERVRISGLIHDVGKIGVPESVLCKPGRLTDDEFDQIKQHPAIGFEILKGIPSLTDILPGVLHHHERWDGKGYPDGLAGEDIPLMARIIGVADTFDAMSSNRSYRSALTRDQVLAEIEKCKGTQFDPAAADAFLSLDLSEYDRMVEKHAAQQVVDSPRPEAA